MVQRFLSQWAQRRVMARRVSPVLLAFTAALCLTSCGFLGHPERPVWRAQAENACFARRQVTLSDNIVQAAEIDGPGICGMTRPLKVSALANGTIAVDKTLTIDCPMVPALEAWLDTIVEPDAQTRFGQRVATVKVFGAYSCRGIDNMPGARLSEHAFGNAVDVAGFTLADGREIDFVRDWKKTDTQEAAFLHEVHAGACQYFTTVLGPGADVFHYNHIHLDLANHGSTDTGPRRICKPTPAPDLLPAPEPRDGLPPAPDIDEPLDIAHLSAPDPVAAPSDAAPGPGDAPDGALPPAPIGESDPSPPILPPGVHPTVDRQPTSSIGGHDE
jgi:hypothetical protein